jgi:hypothetical protein
MQHGTHFHSFQSLVSVDKRGWATGDVKTAACTYNVSSSLFLYDECTDCMHGDVEASLKKILAFFFS